MEKENEDMSFDDVRIEGIQGIECPIHGKQNTLTFSSGVGFVNQEWDRRWCFACVAQILNDQVSMLLWKHEQEQKKKSEKEAAE